MGEPLHISSNIEQVEHQAESLHRSISTLGLKLGLAVVWLCAYALAGYLKNREPKIVYLGHSEVQGERLVHFELMVPSDRRVFLLGKFARRKALVEVIGPGDLVRQPPCYRVDPSDKSFGPGTEFRFSIVEPDLPRWRLEYDAYQRHLGARSLTWRLKRAWKTKRLSDFRKQVITLDRIRSEPVTVNNTTRPVRCRRGK